MADKKFFWGAATSAWQVEGGNHNDWTEWEHANARRLAAEATLAQSRGAFLDYLLNPPAGGPNPLKEENYISGPAANHYNRFKEDFDIAKSLGHNAHRFSIEWSRIEPEEGKFDEKEIAHYKEVIAALRERGLEPFVTIWHFTLPRWLAARGGVLSPHFVERFERYAAKIGEAFKDDVHFWMTINEPDAYCLNGYLTGNWPPQGRNFIQAYRAARRFVHAHRRAYAALKKINPLFEVGIVIDLVYFEVARGIFNALLAWPANIVNEFFLRRVSKSVDFIGLNYYFHNRVKYGFNKNDNKEVSDMGWEIYPEGLYHLISRLKSYKLPIYVTENGVADARDIHRTAFIRDHIASMKKAIAEGADVRGYFYWSLLDNFELDKGFWPRFGLVEVNYKTMERRIRQSAFEYKKIIENND